MDTISEIKWARTLRQLSYIAFRSKDIDLITKDIAFDPFHKFRGIIAFIFQFQNFFKPTHLFGHAVWFDFIGFSLFICPVCRNPEFSNFMHFMGTDLHFKGISFWPDDCCMQGLVHVSFRHRNIIFKTPWHWFPFGMDTPQHRITILDGIHNHTNR